MRVPPWLKRAAPALPAVIAVAALVKASRSFAWTDVQAALTALPLPRVAAAVALTIAGYAVLATFDVLALGATRRRAPTGHALLAGFTGYAVSHTAGYSALTGGTVRHRFYAPHGWSTGDVARLMTFLLVTTALGYCTLAAVALTLAPLWWPAWAFGDPLLVRALAVVPAGLVAAYVAWSARAGRALRVRSWRLEAPPLRVALLQIVAGSAYWTLEAAVPFVLVGPLVPFPVFLAFFVFAQVAIFTARVPAGLGVLEGVLAVALAGVTPVAVIVAGLIAYRVLFHALPLLGGLGVLATRTLGGPGPTGSCAETGFDGA